MSQKIGNIIIIEPEVDRICELCGKKDECRPYGPDGKDICYNCAMKDPIGTEIRLAKVLFGDEITEEEAKGRIIKSGRIVQ